MSLAEVPCLFRFVLVGEIQRDFVGVFKKKNYSTRACWIRDDYSQLGATRLVGYLSSHIQRALVE